MLSNSLGRLLINSISKIWTEEAIEIIHKGTTIGQGIDFTMIDSEGNLTKAIRTIGLRRISSNPKEENFKKSEPATMLIGQLTRTSLFIQGTISNTIIEIAKGKTLIRKTILI